MITNWLTPWDRRKARLTALESVLLETRLTIDAVAIGLAMALGSGRADDVRLAAGLMAGHAPDEEVEEARKAREHAVDLLRTIAVALEASKGKASTVCAPPEGVQ